MDISIVFVVRANGPAPDVSGCGTDNFQAEPHSCNIRSVLLYFPPAMLNAPIYPPCFIFWRARLVSQQKPIIKSNNRECHIYISHSKLRQVHHWVIVAWQYCKRLRQWK